MMVTRSSITSNVGNPAYGPMEVMLTRNTTPLVFGHRFACNANFSGKGQAVPPEMIDRIEWL